MRRIFVQFYSRIKDAHPFYKMKMLEVCNGLSDSMDLCESMGDVIWMEHKIQDNTFGTSEDGIDSYEKFPYEVDEIYVSAFYVSQLYQAYLWAKQMPQTKVVVGGPVALPHMYVLTGELPDNLIISDKSVEEYFNVPNFSHPWRLELPEVENPKDYSLAYTYTIDTQCYWGKCVFCNHSSKSRIRDKVDFDCFPKFEGFQRINMYSPAITRKNLEKVLHAPKQTQRMRYDMYARSTKLERDVWRQYTKILNYKRNPLNLKVTLGVEFPSIRMLKMMRKGFTLEDIMKILQIIGNGKNILIGLPFILGWNILTANDIKELTSFMGKITEYKQSVLTINSLFVKPYTPIYDKYEPRLERQFGPFYCGFYPKLSKEQWELNEEAHDIITGGAPSTVVDYYKGPH